MKRYQLRTPLAAVLLIAAVMFGATTWLAAHVGTNVLEPAVMTGLVISLGVRRLAAAFQSLTATSKSSRTAIREMP